MHDEGDFEDTEILLECPECQALVGYGEVLVIDFADDKSGCPVCNAIVDTDSWFA